MTPENRLALARDILSTDWAAEAEDVKMDEYNHNPVTEREKRMAEVILNLYRALHPSDKCPHKDWDMENQIKFEQIET